MIIQISKGREGQCMIRFHGSDLSPIRESLPAEMIEIINSIIDHIRERN